MTKIVNKSPTLVSTTKKGLKKYWFAEILQSDKKVYLSTTYWQELADGGHSVKQTSAPYEVTPKNVGRANETSAEAQAQLELTSLIKKQRDKGYAPEGEEASDIPRPMLAHKFADRSHNIQWPAAVQPKLNGMRMLFDGETGWTRGGKTMIPEVIQHLTFNTKGVILDGELILPGNVLLQETMSAAKKFRPDVSPLLLYKVYDIVDDELTFKERFAQLQLTLSRHGVPKNIEIVPTIMLESEDELPAFHKRQVSQGYEGAMVRDLDSLYIQGDRSEYLLKYKMFQDAEFKIVDVLEGEGSDKGLAIFECVTKDGGIFKCRPEGTQEYRRKLWNNRKALVGKWLTVKFAELTKDKIPQFPVGIEVRDKGEF